MRKVIAKVTAIVLTLAMAAGISPVVTQQSDAAKSKLKVVIKIKNKDDFVEMDLGQEETVKYKVTVSGGTATERKKAKDVTIKVSGKTDDDKDVLKLDGKKVKAKNLGKGKITIESKCKKGGKPIAKASVNVEVSEPEEELDMIFKYPTLYYVVEDGKFPVSIEQGKTADYKGKLFDIKTLGFKTKPALTAFTYSYETGGVAQVDAAKSTLVLTGYGTTDIEASYDKDDSVGDVLTVCVMTPEQYKAAEEDGLIEDVEENEFETEEEDDNGGSGADEDDAADAADDADA